jgi:hypothetical protein
MTLQYEWKLKSLVKQNSSNLMLNGIIVQTQWELTGTDEDGYSGTFSGATPFDPNQVDPTNFTEYENLTEQQVLGWIQNVVNTNATYKQHIDGRIQEQIDKQKMPTEQVSDTTFPWASSANTADPVPTTNTGE